jgi:hypothetical protein
MEKWNGGMMGDEVTIILVLLRFTDGIMEKWMMEFLII